MLIHVLITIKVIKPMWGGLSWFCCIFQSKSVWTGYIRFSPVYEFAIISGILLLLSAVAFAF
jgi:hypothetical protein